MTNDTDSESERLPEFAWCRDCWDQAAPGTRGERTNDLPEACEDCGSGKVFWI